MDIEYEYEKAKTNLGDINEHIETLYKYSKECNHIIECGVRGCVSTWAFLKGLLDNNSESKRLIGVDLDWHENIDDIEKVSKENRIDYVFIQGNDIEVDLEETDLLFIDTWHIYGHLKRELNKHHSKVKKYIIMHDTTVDEWLGETIRGSRNAEEQSKISGYPVDEICKGLWPAIEEFLQEHPEFRIKERFTNNNGLTILERIPEKKTKQNITCFNGF